MKFDDLLQWESKQEKKIFYAILILLIISAGFALYPAVKATHSKNDINTDFSESSKTPEEYYEMFQCSCCGSPIDANCCGMAETGKEYLDELISEGLKEEEIMVSMVKKFGFDILMDKSKESEIKDYIKKQASDNPPIINLEKTVYDFGVISQTKGEVSTSFTLKNTGESDLVIDGFDTSCMCTSASIVYNNIESPRFGMSMHGANPKDFALSIPPGDSAELKVYYDPMAHGKQTEPELNIIREVTIISNDPVNFQKKVRIELKQIP